MKYRKTHLPAPDNKQTLFYQHLNLLNQLSFLGAVGTLMEGSGLQEALEQITAKNLVPRVLSGKAQEMAFRADMLAPTALNHIILKTVLYRTQEGDEDMTESEHRDADLADASKEADYLKPIPSPVSSSNNDSDHESFTEYIKRSQDVSITMPDVMSSEDIFAEVQQFLSSMTDGTLTFEDLSYSPSLTEIQSKLTTTKNELQYHMTSRLWLQYLDMIHLLKMHCNAERTGQSEDKLYILTSMKPYLTAAGHYQYAKSISLFLVEMMRMKKEEQENWTKLA